LIASLKVAVTVVAVETPVVPLAGVTLITVGGVVSAIVVGAVVGFLVVVAGPHEDPVAGAGILFFAHYIYHWLVAPPALTLVSNNSCAAGAIK